MKYVTILFLIFNLSISAQEDTYHSWLKNYIDSAYSVTGGEWVVGNNENSTNSLAQFTNIIVTISDINSEEPFSKRITFINNVQRENSWDAAVRYPISSGIHEGDAVLLVIWVKAYIAHFGTGLLTHVFEKVSTPWTKSLETSHIPSDDWQMWMLPFRLTSPEEPDIRLTWAS